MKGTRRGVVVRSDEGDPTRGGGVVVVVRGEGGEGGAGGG